MSRISVMAYPMMMHFMTSIRFWSMRRKMEWLGRSGRVYEISANSWANLMITPIGGAAKEALSKK